MYVQNLYTCQDFVIYICLNPDVPPLSDEGTPTRRRSIRPMSSCMLQCRHASSGCSSGLTAGGCSLTCRSCTMCPSWYETRAMHHHPENFEGCTAQWGSAPVHERGQVLNSAGSDVVASHCDVHAIVAVMSQQAACESGSRAVTGSADNFCSRGGGVWLANHIISSQCIAATQGCLIPMFLLAGEAIRADCRWSSRGNRDDCS